MRAKTVSLVVLIAAMFVVPLPGASAQTTEEADLAIDVTDSPDPAYYFDEYRYDVSVLNFGPNSAQDVVLTTHLPDGLNYNAIRSDSRCSENAGAVTCRFSSWGANAAGIVTIGVTPTAVGDYQLDFHIASATPDPDLSNNSQTET
ncbi:MAG: hypothetical protein ACRDKT_12550, partial [Actinomycetota bacterium]